MFVIGTGAWLFLPFVIPVVSWIRRSAKRDFTPMKITPQPEPCSSKAAVLDQNDLVSYLKKQTLLYSVLVDRAGSEMYLKQKQLPEGSEITTRRTHLGLLKSAGIWDTLSPSDREIITIPDGNWGWDLINRVTTSIERLRSLRWILRIDFRLPAIGQSLAGDFSIAHELVTNPEKISNANQLIELDAIRIAREEARTILLRCFAESVSRGYLQPEDVKTKAWAREVSESLHGKQDEDLLLGDELVSEASRTKLTLASTLARIREEFLSRAVALIDRSKPLPGQLESIFTELSAREQTIP
jgi:hypothetical protein